MKSAINEFQAREEVNTFLGGFFEPLNKEGFMSSYNDQNPKHGIRVLNQIKKHIDQVGTFPLVVLKINDLRSSKEKSLMEQLQVDLFRHKFGATIDLKLDKSDRLLLKVMNNENVPLSILSTEIITENALVYSDNNESMDVEIHGVDTYHARIRENGKKLCFSESLFSKFLEELFMTQYYKSNDHSVNDDFTTSDDLTCIPLQELNSFSLMNMIANDNNLSEMLTSSIDNSKDNKYIKKQEKESEKSFSM